MQRELAASGLSPEEILAKTLLLQKAMAGDNSPAFINKTLKNALNVANLNKDDLTKVNKLWQLNINWNFRIDIKYVKYFPTLGPGWVRSLQQIGDFPHFWSFVNH